jgi:hypothetical protein
LYLYNTTANTISRVLAANDNEEGVLLFTGALDDTVAHATLANDDHDGVSAGSDGNVIAQVAAVNNRGAGIQLYTESHGMQLISANNVVGVETDTDPPELSGAIVVGANTQDCDIKVGSAYTNNCTPISSSATVITGIDLAGSLRAAVTTDDAANASDSNGAALRSTITDWYHFDDPSRAWGEDGPWPGAAGMCVTNCRIWDWRRTPGDTMLVARDRFGVASDEPLVPGQQCPPRLDGDNAAMDASSRYFLLGAVELLGDGDRQ